jgi:predicted nucleic acid-binding protein
LGILLEIGDGYARLGRRRKANDLLQRFQSEDRYHVEPLTESLLDEGMEIYLSRSDKEWGLTDCVSFALMRARGLSEALTVDVHFRQAGFTALLLAK